MRASSARLAGLVAVSLLACLYALPQATVLALAPSCPFHAATGLLCPGCGATRATLALVHGQLRSAWHANPFFVALLPLALAYTVLALRSGRFPALPTRISTLLLASTLLFTILRNLP